MAVAASKFSINQTLPKRGQIKIKIFNLIAKSITNLAHGFVGEDKNAAVISAETDGEFNSGFKPVIKKNGPKRGQNQIKIMILKTIAKSFTDLVTGVAGGKKEYAGNGGCTGGCFTSPATVIPVEVTGELNPASGIKKKRANAGRIKIKISKRVSGSVMEGYESDGKKKGTPTVAISSAPELIPVGLF